MGHFRKEQPYESYTRGVMDGIALGKIMREVGENIDLAFRAKDAEEASRRFFTIRRLLTKAARKAASLAYHVENCRTYHDP